MFDSVYAKQLQANKESIKMNPFDYELQKRVTNGCMSRRNFIKAASVMGLSAAAQALYS